MDTKTRPIYMLSTRDPLQTKGQIQTESEGMEKDIPCKQKSKESWSSNTHINKIDFKIKNVTTEGRTLRNDQGNNPRRRYNNYKCICIYAPNIGAPQYIRQILTAIKEEINSKTVILGDCNTSLTPMNRSFRQKINKETQALNDTIDQIDLIDISRTFHLKTADYTFFSSAHGTFSRIDHILGHKSSLGKFKKIEIISSIFSDHNTMRLEISYREKM